MTVERRADYWVDQTVAWRAEPRAARKAAPWVDAKAALWACL